MQPHRRCSAAALLALFVAPVSIAPVSVLADDSIGSLVEVHAVEATSQSQTVLESASPPAVVAKTAVGPHSHSPCSTCGAQPGQSYPGCHTCCHGKHIDWPKYPVTINPMPRPGIFPIPPSGPGYFSAWDHLTGQCRPGSPQSGYAAFAINAWPFFDADWRYVEKIPPSQRTWVERMKRIHLTALGLR